MVKIHYLRHPWHGPDFWTGMLFIEGRGSHFLLDTAVKEAVDTTLAAFLRERDIPWNAISQIINTHAHGDHFEGNPQLRERTGAEFSIHKNGADKLRRAGFLPDRELEDGMELTCDGITVRIIHTPGHSDDSICILEPETGTLFTGDSVQAQGSRNIGLALYTDPVSYRASLVKIRGLCRSGEVRRLVLGHPERPSEGEVEQEELNAFLNLSIQTVDRYSAATAQLLREKPDADRTDVRNRLLEQCGLLALPPSWPELSFVTAGAHLKMFTENGGI